MRSYMLQKVLKEFGLLFFLKYIFYKFFRDREQYNSLIYSTLAKECQNEIIKENDSPALVLPQAEAVPIWICWWQGYDNMPELCKLCYESVKRNLPQDCELHLITKDNYSEYILIPDNILEKCKKKIYPVAILTDWMRHKLLCEYGGFWIDATVYCSQNVSSSFLRDPHYWSIKLPKELVDTNCRGQVVSQCMYGSFIQKACPHNSVNQFVLDCLTKYLDKYNVYIEYFIQNFLIRIGYDHCKNIQTEIDDIPVSNLHLYHLDRLMNRKFDEELWNGMNKDTMFYKLSWRKKYHKYDEEGNLTFYGYLCKMYSQGPDFIAYS